MTTPRSLRTEAGKRMLANWQLDTSDEASADILAIEDEAEAAAPRSGEGLERLYAAIEDVLANPRPMPTDKDALYWYERAQSRLRVAYGVERGYITPCPVPSSVTGQTCLLPDGHPQDSAGRFHRYARENTDA